MTEIKIEDLAKDIDDLKQKRFKLPAKAPAIYKQSDGNFKLYADNLENYFDILNVGDDERSRLLLTFLSNEDYQTITRVYPAKILATEKYSIVAEKLSHLLSDNISSAHALSKLTKLKQNNMSMIDFVKKLEHLGQIAFPEDDMKDAKERCLIHSLQNNCRSKVLAYEIYSFVKSAKPGEKKDFSEVTLKCLELDQVLGKNENDSDEGLTMDEKIASVFNVSKNQGMLETQFGSAAGTADDNFRLICELRADIDELHHMIQLLGYDGCFSQDEKDADEREDPGEGNDPENDLFDDQNQERTPEVNFRLICELKRDVDELFDIVNSLEDEECCLKGVGDGGYQENDVRCPNNE